jgi:hypothetical protein
MSWRLARSLVVLRDEVNTLCPGRNKTYDGTIGDENHQGRNSDHNPNDYNVVCALDLTHDPAHGADMFVISKAVANSKHPNLKYCIFDRRIWNKAGWHRYTGSNPHDHHMHVSVGFGPDGQSEPPFDDMVSWGIATVKPTELYELTSPYMHGERIRQIQVALQSRGYYLDKLDGIYGPLTETAVRKFQRDRGLVVDGKVGTKTLKALGV